MIHDKDLYFLCDKVIHLRMAIFINFSTALLKFPVSVVEVSSTDKKGNLWFRISKPYQCIGDFEQSFPAQLHFYNKDCNYRLTAQGNATIVNDSQETKSKAPFNLEINDQYAIIKFEILSAEYFYYKQSNHYLLISLVNNMINKILLHEGPLQYRF